MTNAAKRGALPTHMGSSSRVHHTGRTSIMYGHRNPRIPEVGLAALIAFSALLRIPGMSIVPLAAPLTLLFLPVVLQPDRMTRRLAGWILVILTVGAAVSLTLPGNLGSPGELVYVAQTILWIMGGALTIIGIAWSCRFLRTQYLLIIVGAGSLVSTVIDPVDSDNWWKFGGSTGIAIIAFATSEKLGPVWRILVAASLALVNVVFDFRSLAIICFMVLAIALWSKPIRSAAERGRWALIWLLATTAATVTAVFSYVVSSGWAGQSLLKRAEYQTSLGQNAILGGRTEWGATLDLMHTYILGFGPGTLPSSDVVRSAVHAAGLVGGDIFSPYFYREVFSNRVDLHSSMADLWFHFGLAGLMASFAILWTIYGGATSLLRSEVECRTALMVLYMLAAWDLLFSPMVDSAKISLALGIIYGISSRPNLGFTDKGRSRTSGSLYPAR